jgi:hypothetical protein
MDVSMGEVRLSDNGGERTQSTSISDFHPVKGIEYAAMSQEGTRNFSLWERKRVRGDLQYALRLASMARVANLVNSSSVRGFEAWPDIV